MTKQPVWNYDLRGGDTWHMERGGDARRKLKETDLGVAQAFCDP